VWQTNESVHVLDVLLVTDLEYEPSANGTPKRRRRES
jgi:hypothetical protein